MLWESVCTNVTYTYSRLSLDIMQLQILCERWILFQEVNCLFCYEKGTVVVALHWKFELYVGGWRVFANATMLGWMDVQKLSHTISKSVCVFLCEGICILVQQCWAYHVENKTYFVKRKNAKSSALNNSTTPIAIQPGTCYSV